MEPESNGEKLPAITIEWDAKAQQPRIKFDSNEFRTWDFVEAVLHVAVEQAKFQLNVCRMQGMQQAQMEAAMAQQISQGLGRRPRIHQ